MPTIDDYLTKQIYIDKNVVTFRSLSRQFGIHVNAAKNELATFHTNSVTPDTRSFATYLVSGEPFPQARANLITSTQTTQDSMDVDSGLAEAVDEVEDLEDVPITTMTLVGENDLEDAKSKYARIFSVHVYCLSPSPLKDAGHICDPSVIVYKADAVDAPASSIVLGRIVGPDVRIGKVPLPIASSSKVPEPEPRKPTPKVPSEDVKPTESGRQKSDTPKLKTSGTLDWSKAKKAPETKKSEKVKKEESPARKVKERTPTKSESESPKDDGRRGVKRKAAPLPVFDVEEKPKVKEKSKPKGEKPKPAPVNDSKLHRNRIVSDDEDEDYAPLQKPAGKGKSRASAIAAVLQTEEERSLRAMMDMDDDEVENASKGRPRPKLSSSPAIPSDEDIEMAASEPEPVPPSEPERDDDEDMDMEDVPRPKKPPARKKRAPKEPVPIGRNGLKKKQVKRTVITTDAKGYMQSTDVFEWESVDEEEEAEEEKEKEAKKAGKGKKATAAKPKKGDADEDGKDSSAAPKPLKPAARSNSVKKNGRAKPKPSAQGSLKDFFGRPKT